MFLKIHKSYRDVVALCDSDLLGKHFEEGDKQLDVKENFYKGEEKTPEEILNILDFYAKEDATFNIVGQEACQIALKAGIMTKDQIGKIKNIHFALVLL